MLNIYPNTKIGKLDVLDVAAYDAAEAAASEKWSNRILQAFSPELFATLGYPSRVKEANQLWRFIDVMHETRVVHNIESLLCGLTTDEFELFKRATRIVDEHATTNFGMRAHATAALLRAIHVLRLIKIVTGNERPTVLEVGPGCGYLGMLLVMEGYPYIGTDVVQAFYLYQNRMLSTVATSLHELAVTDADILSVKQPTPGTAIHIPWWKWITLTPNKVKLSAGIMTSNHVLCEMHPSSLGYLAVLGHQILANHPGGGKFIFENWGCDVLHSRHSVAEKFAQHGLRVCHDEYVMSAMVLAEEIEQWLGRMQPGQAARSKPNAQMPSLWEPATRARVAAALGYVPPLKRMAITILHLLRRLRRKRHVQVVKGPDGAHPLSKQLVEGRAAVIARATIGHGELQGFLRSHFGGTIPTSMDETFCDVIGTRL